MELSEYKSTLPLELLAASLATRLTLDELEWLTRDLARRTEGERREEAQSKSKERVSATGRRSLGSVG
jgi:hypothetical protein